MSPSRLCDMTTDVANSLGFFDVPVRSPAGTQFGFRVTNSRSSEMTLVAAEADGVLFTPRDRDRRQGIGELLSTLTRSLDRRLDVSLMRGGFEETLRRLLPVRSVQLRDMGSRWASRIDGGAIESIALDVPAADASAAGVLEATFDPGCRLGEWEFQILGFASHV